jgi:hypothetical protein
MLGPDHTRSGPGEDMTKQPSPALLDPHNPRGTGDDQRNASTGPHTGERDQKPLAGLHHHYPGRTDRAVKASPPGGLRPALDRPTPDDHRREAAHLGAPTRQSNSPDAHPRKG